MTTSFAEGGEPVLGKPKNVTQLKDPASGKLYDFDRDVMVFMPYMVDGVIRAMQNRTLPALKELLEDNVLLEQRLVACMTDLMLAMRNKDAASYSSVIEQWRKSQPEEAVDIILMIFGRALLEFYMACAFDLSKPGERFAGGMEAVLYKQLGL